MALQLFDANSDFFFPGFPSMRHAFSGQGRSEPRGILLDVTEKPKAYELAADLPGVAKEDIKLNVDGDVLSLSVEKVAKKEDQVNTRYHRIERTTNYMKRSLRMPDSADLSKISARYQDGVLRLDIPKLEAQVERSRAIPIL